MEKEEVKISVRELVEFILRSGDIDNRRGGWADKESLAKGTRIHKKIQRQEYINYPLFGKIKV